MSKLITFIRCQYINEETNLECEEVFPSFEGEARILCDLHKNIISPTLAAEINDKKSIYKQRRQEFEARCAHMTIEELGVHLADLDEKIENLKMHYFVARGTRQAKLADLSDAEQQVRRNAPRPQKPSEAKPKKVSVKADPVKHLMQNMNLTEAQARSLLGLPDIFGRKEENK